VIGSMFGGAFISCSGAVTWIDGTGYVVSSLDGVNGVRRHYLVRTVAKGCRCFRNSCAPADLWGETRGLAS
jgi:hypothetical protein